MIKWCCAVGRRDPGGHVVVSEVLRTQYSTGRDVWRHEDRRHSWSITVESEVRRVRQHFSTRNNRGGRNDVIETTAVLVVGDDQQCSWPVVIALRECVVDGGQQDLAF